MTNHIYLTRDEKRLVEQSIDLDDLQMKLFAKGLNPEIDYEEFNRLKNAYKYPMRIRVRLLQGEY